MNRPGLAGLVLLVCAAIAAAQPAPDPRPPQRPAQQATAPSERTAPPAPEENATATVDSPETFGPPMPPHHAMLRESDADYDACLFTLAFLGTVYEEQPPLTVPENADCGIARPIRVTQVIPGVELDGGAVMRCDTARALGFWTRDFLRPAAAALPGSPRLLGMQTGSTYTCRDRVGTGDSDAKPSEHAYGNAIDIMGFRLSKDQVVAVQPRIGDGDGLEAFQRAARASACLWFSTVLGPGSNAAHDDHLHLDVIRRGSGWRLCE